MTQLGPGDFAPSFELRDHDGNATALRDLAGRRLVLYFFPKADTAG